MPAALPLSFNPNYLDEIAITRALANGTHAPVLQAYFGSASYQELCSLAQQALQTRIDVRAPQIYLLPGLLGSKLGISSTGHTDLLWLDPANVAAGKLTQLTIGRRRSIRPIGVMLTAYLKLKLTLQAAGMPVKLYSYDWRRSAIKLGQQLADDLLHEPAAEVMLVAHSMGGLVARAALKYPAAAKVTRVVQLGTPNQGSFALLQTLRACYPTVRKLGALDQMHSAEQLTAQVFRSFYSFYEMLPRPTHTPGLNLLDQSHWPADELAPKIARLVSARRASRHLAEADRRCHLITGIDQRTVTGVRRNGNEFAFQFSHAGDGTVPVALAHWDKARHWYIREVHGQLPRNTTVCEAVVDLLQNETTQLLPSTAPEIGQAGIVEYTESDLKQLAGRKVRWEMLSLDERRELLEPVITEAFTAACNQPLI